MPAKPLPASAVKYLAIHCSATSPKANVDAKVIDRWHRQRGWLGIGYHFVITRSGEVQTGRPLTEIGAHVEGFNHCSVGICLAGGVDAAGKAEDNFTGDQYAALAVLVQALRQKFPGAVVQGHRDFPNVRKDCPCFDVRGWLKDTVDV